MAISIYRKDRYQQSMHGILNSRSLTTAMHSKNFTKRTNIRNSFATVTKFKSHNPSKFNIQTLYAISVCGLNIQIKPKEITIKYSQV